MFEILAKRRSAAFGMPRVLRPGPPPRLARRLCRCRTGVISVELALISPVLLLLLVGAVDFGRAFNEQLRLASAARAGVQHAVENLGASESMAGVVDAALLDAQLASEEVAVSTDKYCTCPDGASAACSSSCGGSVAPLMHVAVTLQRDFPLLFDYPGLSPVLPLSATATMRAR